MVVVRQEGSPGFEAPEVLAEEKAYVRSLLPQGLADEHSKIRTAVGMAIACVADHDWPHAWPQLTELLVNGIRNRASPASGTVPLYLPPSSSSTGPSALRVWVVEDNSPHAASSPSGLRSLDISLGVISRTPCPERCWVLQRAQFGLHPRLCALNAQHSSFAALSRAPLCICCKHHRRMGRTRGGALCCEVTCRDD